jgi:hypothetical protein
MGDSDCSVVYIIFLKKLKIKRFTPVGILASFLMVLYNVVAYNEKHWTIKVTIIPWLKPLFVPGVLSVFLVVTIWIFYFTYPRFWIYLTTNLVVDFMFAVFPFHYILQNKLGVYELINITSWGRYLIFVIFSIILYGYQKWLEEVFKTN